MTTINANSIETSLEAYDYEITKFGYRTSIGGDRYSIVCFWTSRDSRRIEIAATRADDFIPQGFLHVSDFVAEHEAEDEFGPWTKADAELAIRRYFEHLAR